MIITNIIVRFLIDFKIESDFGNIDRRDDMDGMQDTSVFLLLHQILHLSKYQAMKRMEALDLKPSQAGILFLLNKHEGIS